MDLPSMIAVGVNTCGVYVSPVPPTTVGGGSATASPSHMAFWDGTSFATGITSGYVARQGIPDGGVFSRAGLPTLQLAKTKGVSL